MHFNLRDLKLRIRALVAGRRVERELDEELAFHIECEIRKHVANGLEPAEARARARARFGPVALAADQCRDARGTAFIDASLRDLQYAVRGFRRTPLAAATIIATIGLGLGLVAVVFTVYSAIFLRADDVSRPWELFEVRRPPSPGLTAVWVQLTRPDYEALRRDTGVLTDTSAMLEGIATRVDGGRITGTLVTGNFFQMVDVQAMLGRALAASDDDRFAVQPVVVLSYRGWTKLFGSDRGVIGRRVNLNGIPTEIIGVMPPGFRGLAIAPPDYWAPLGLLGQLRQDLAGHEDRAAIAIVGRLRPGVSIESATASLTAWAVSNPEMKAISRRPKTIRLQPRQGTAQVDALDGLRKFAPLFFAFGLILMIGCANVANLLLARGVARQREIGVRLSLGASRRRIVRQLLTESLLLAFGGALFGFAVLRAALELGTRAVAAKLAPGVSELVGLAALAIDWRVLVFLVCGAMASTVLFGLLPALQATRLELVRTMRGELARDARPGRARHVLIAAQVSASAVLLICAAVFLRSTFAVASVQPGLRTLDTALLEMPNESTRSAMLRAVEADPSVAAMAVSSPHGVGGELAEAFGSNQAPVEYKFVSPEYFELLDIAFVRGRGFTQAERHPASGLAVVSETTARRLWPDRDPIGEVLQLSGVRSRAAVGPDGGSTPQLPLRAFAVVGVVRDARIGQGTFEQVDAGVYIPIAAESAGTSLVLRLHGDPAEAKRRIVERLSKVDPAMAEIHLLRDITRLAAYVLRVAFWLTAVLGAIALMLTVSGLFSVLSYVVAQRSKEIGVRIALGATTRDIARLVLLQSSLPVGVGLAAGVVFAGSVAGVLMTTSLASSISEVVRLYDPLAYASSLLCIVAACTLAAAIPAIRAARIDPIATLKQD